ncbi:MAG: hypothetical protein Q9161_006604 [Pseudevernia consocians]
MSRTFSTSSQEAPTSLVKSIAYLPTAITKKFTGSNKIAPLFVAPCVEEDEFEDAVELACGHIMFKRDYNEVKGARFGLIGNSSSFLANLSIFEATRCPMCKSGLLASKDAGSEPDFGGAALRDAEKHTADRKGGRYGLERQDTADEQTEEDGKDEKLLEPSADESLDASFGETLMGACRRVKKALSVTGAGGLSESFVGA